MQSEHVIQSIIRLENNVAQLQSDVARIEGSVTRLEGLIMRNSLMIEELGAQFQLVIEHVSGVETRLTQRMDQRFAEQDRRFDVIELVLQHHSDKLNENERRWDRNEKRWSENEKRWDENEKRWSENERRWNENSQRWDENGKKLMTIEQKIDRLDKTFSTTTAQVEQHESELRTLRLVPSNPV